MDSVHGENSGTCEKGATSGTEILCSKFSDFGLQPSISNCERAANMFTLRVALVGLVRRARNRIDETD